MMTWIILAMLMVVIIVHIVELMMPRWCPLGPIASALLHVL